MYPIIPVWDRILSEAYKIISRVVLVVTLLCGFKWPRSSREDRFVLSGRVGREFGAVQLHQSQPPSRSHRTMTEPRVKLASNYDHNGLIPETNRFRT